MADSLFTEIPEPDYSDCSDDDDVTDPTSGCRGSENIATTLEAIDNEAAEEHHGDDDAGDKDDGGDASLDFDGVLAKLEAFSRQHQQLRGSDRLVLVDDEGCPKTRLRLSHCHGCMHLFDSPQSPLGGVDRVMLLFIYLLDT